jgi:ABC-type glutathione transport system ATPase component
MCGAEAKSGFWRGNLASGVVDSRITRDVSTSTLLRVRGLSVNYTSTRSEIIPALHNVNLEVAPQQVVGVLGQSGSGKSSLSHAILKMLPGNAGIEGSIEFGGRDLLKMPERELRGLRGAGIALVSQEPALALNPVLTIGRQIIDVLQAHQRVSYKEAKERARTMLAEVGFSEPDRILSAYPHQLSGGQRQRAAIAQALICSPELVIADEPLSSLDTITQAEILELFKKVKRDLKLSMIFVTHNAGVLSALADRVVVLAAGQVRTQGTIEELSAQKDDDYVRGLIFPEKTLAQEAVCQQKTTDAEVLLEVKNLGKQFTQRRFFSRQKFAVQALEGIDLELGEGTSTAIIGRSGSGKTTLARCIAGFEIPDAGEVKIGGTEEKQRRREVQLIFQDAGTALNPRFTAAEIISEPLDIAGELTITQRKERACQLMKEVGLDPEWHARKAGEFSGGQRQRLALARALAASPRLLILDESLSGLDLPLQAQMLRLLLDLQVRHQLTLLHITHDLNFLPLFAEEVVVMDAGKIVERCIPAKLLHSSHPATRALIEASEQLHLPGLEAAL